MIYANLSATTPVSAAAAATTASPSNGTLAAADATAASPSNGALALSPEPCHIVHQL